MAQPISTRLLLTAVWGLLTVALLGLGYGSDADSWYVAINAAEMAASGRYIASRFPGFPLYECLSFLPIQVGSWWGGNLLSWLSGLGVAWVWSGEMYRHAQSPLWATICLAFAPIWMMVATSTLDFAPGIWLVVAGYSYARKGQWQWAAVLWGLAVGMRLTHGIWIGAGLGYLLLDRQSPLMVIRWGIMALGSAGLAYFPYWGTYGLPLPGSGMLTALPDWRVIGYNGLAFWGLVQTIILVVLYFMPRNRPFKELRTKWGGFHLTIICLHLLAFVLHPDEPEYLLGALPSFVWGLDQRLTAKRLFWAMCTIISFHVIQLEVKGGTSGNRYLDPQIRPGFSWVDIQDRRWKLSTRAAAAQFSPPTPTLLIMETSWWRPDQSAWQLVPSLGLYQWQDRPFYLQDVILDPDQIKQLHQQGFEIHIWEGYLWPYIKADQADVIAQYMIVHQSLDRFSKLLYQELHRSGFRHLPISRGSLVGARQCIFRLLPINQAPTP